MVSTGEVKESGVEVARPSQLSESDELVVSVTATDRQITVKRQRRHAKLVVRTIGKVISRLRGGCQATRGFTRLPAVAAEAVGRGSGSRQQARRSALVTSFMTTTPN